jgi:hypothetical protein
MHKKFDTVILRKCKTLIKYFRLKSDVITILKLRIELIDKG